MMSLYQTVSRRRAEWLRLRDERGAGDRGTVAAGQDHARHRLPIPALGWKRCACWRCAAPGGGHRSDDGESAGGRARRDRAIRADGLRIGDPAGVRQCVAVGRSRGIRLDAVICNAGIKGLPETATRARYEAQFFTNHIGHFMLVTGLLGPDADRAGGDAASSTAHTRASRAASRFDISMAARAL